MISMFKRAHATRPDVMLSAGARDAAITIISLSPLPTTVDNIHGLYHNIIVQ